MDGVVCVVCVFLSFFLFLVFSWRTVKGRECLEEAEEGVSGGGGMVCINSGASIVVAGGPSASVRGV